MSVTKSNHLAAVITKVMYQFAHNIDSFTVGQSVNHRLVTFKSGADWLQFYFSPGTAVFSEPKQDSMHGPAFNQTLELKTPGDMAESYPELDYLDQFPVIVKFTYNNGLEKIIGSENVPALFENNFGSSNEKTESTVRFTCLSTVRSFIYQAEEIEEIVPPIED
jgi:hypothetical protein